MKLIVGVFLVLVVALFVVDFLASKVAERTYIETLRRELADKGRMIGLLEGDRLVDVDDSRLHAIAKSAGGRLTLIAKDGRVLADSEANRANMENHANRKEVAEALRGETGVDVRNSHTIGVKFLYVAVPQGYGALRLAVPLSEIQAQVDRIREQLLMSVVLAFLPAVIVAFVFARYVSSKLGSIIEYAGKLARGDFEARLQIRNKDEFGLLSQQLNETGEKLQKMFEELQHEHEQLEKLERIRKDFVINVSHELRTPLASIQGYTETLLDGAIHEPEHNVRFLSIIRNNAERLGRLVADLMTLSRIELKSTKFQFASYFVNTLLEDCVDSVRPMSEKKNIDITLRRAQDRTEVFCDSEAVHQIVINLLDNALKYTPEGGAIEVGARELPVTSGLVEIYVRDTGIGIPAEDLPRLFERFYRVDKARSRELGGTGLGLAIVKHLVRAMGGDIKVQSQLGKGSTFSFTLQQHDIGLIEDATVQAELTAL
ncbi:MAG TPA: ATP-binding protein [Bryobacteraceae bacterium]|nr:ATP-binding protein [Bryobacteraceae bacterium]